MPSDTIKEFIRRSGQLTLLLSAGANDFKLILEMLGRPPPPPHERAMLLAIRYVRKVYGDDKRKIGTYSVLHPLRVASALGRCELESNTDFDALDFLVAIAHDLEEEFSQGRLRSAASEFEELLAVLDEKQRWYARERVHVLTRSKEPGQSYFAYLCELLERGEQIVNLVRIKAADKLDAVLDYHLMAPSACDIDFYLTMFEILCVPCYRGLEKPVEPPVGRKEMELFVSNLTKSLLFVSLVRQSEVGKHDPVAQQLCDQLIEGSIRQTEVILLSYLMERLPAASEQRQAIIAGLEYCQDPVSVTSVTPRKRGHFLDGTLLEGLALDADDQTRKRLIAEMLDDNPIRATALLFVMIAVFRCYAMDRDFFIKGISKEGIKAHG